MMRGLTLVAVMFPKEALLLELVGPANCVWLKAL
jgi:hypothetical protein